MTIRGLSSTGDEVFEAWVGFGSGNTTRFVYARGAGDTTYTRTATNAGNPAGTLIYNQISGDWNGTNNASKPGGMDTLTIEVVDGLVTYGLSTGNAGSTLTFAQNSGATDLARLEFASLNNRIGENAGFWLDNITVNSTFAPVPEPGSAVLLGVLALAGLVRCRRIR